MLSFRLAWKRAQVISHLTTPASNDRGQGVQRRIQVRWERRWLTSGCQGCWRGSKLASYRGQSQGLELMQRLGTKPQPSRESDFEIRTFQDHFLQVSLGLSPSPLRNIHRFPFLMVPVFAFTITSFWQHFCQSSGSYSGP